MTIIHRLKLFNVFLKCDAVQYIYIYYFIQLSPALAPVNAILAVVANTDLSLRYSIHNNKKRTLPFTHIELSLDAKI